MDSRVAANRVKVDELRVKVDELRVKVDELRVKVTLAILDALVEY